MDKQRQRYHYQTFRYVKLLFLLLSKMKSERETKQIKTKLLKLYIQNEMKNRENKKII